MEFQTLVLRGDLDAALAMLPDVADDQKNKIARFLEGQGFKEQALEIATDPEHRFDLALGLGELGIALELARAADVEHRWKTVGDAALAGWDLALAEECFTHAKDLGSLLLLHSSTGNASGLRSLAAEADASGANNIAFSCLWQLADVQGCVELLTKTGRTAEAVLFAQTYCPSVTPKVVGTWRGELEEKGKAKLARTLGVPPGAEEGQVDEELFPEWEEWLRLEEEEKAGQGEMDEVEVNGGANGVHEDDEVVVENEGLDAFEAKKSVANGEEDGAEEAATVEATAEEE